jgi:hypothetical protein
MNAQNEKAARQLNDVRQFAKDKIATGAEPPWAWYQYMKLIEASEAILAGMGVTTESSQLSTLPVGGRLRLVGPNDSPDTVQSRPSDTPVQMPM